MAGMRVVSRQLINSPSSSLMRRSTRDLAWRMAAALMASSWTKVHVGRPSIAESQKACQVGSWNSHAHLLDRLVIKAAHLEVLTLGGVAGHLGNLLQALVSV